MTRCCRCAFITWGGGLSVEGILSGEGVVIHAAHLVKVGARVEFPAFELLGAHEEDRAHDRLLLVHRLDRGRLAELGEAEVEDLELVFPEACQITMMLVGLMSRWITLFACAAMSASIVW